jgi:adenylosuccinate lyase
LGVVPKEAVAEIKAKATFDMVALVPRIDEIERRTKHDVVAFTEAAERSPASHIHWASPRTFLIPAWAARWQAADLLEDVAAVEAALAALAVQRRDRHRPHHGIHAEPTTGLETARLMRCAASA